MSEEAVSAKVHHLEYPKVELNFEGVFTRSPLTYHDGITYRFTDHDFGGMNLSECIVFLERFTQQQCKKLYYCPPNKSLDGNIRHIKEEMDYHDFVVDSYTTDGFISLYVDHFGDELDDYFGADREQAESENEGQSEQEQEPESEHSHQDSCSSGVVKKGKDKDHGNLCFTNVNGNAEGKDVDKARFTDVPVESDDDIPNKNRTRKDEFLSKLCVEEEDEGCEDASVDMDEVAEGERGCSKQIHPIFNEETHWKKQMPVLGMRFKNPAHLKTMLCNYAVTHGYQLYYEKSDSKRILAKCCKGECSFRLWATWMSDEVSFQIKSLKSEHNCARNYKLGAIVTYKWLGSHYTKEILHRKKMSARKLRLEVIKKFGIHVSIGQCRRAKTYALELIEGNLVEHYARLWSYAEELRRSNPGSNVRLDVEQRIDGKNYFSKFYVCFAALKKGWMAGCRRVIGLDGCFLKGLCKGELLTAIGRDGNDQMFPIAWAVVCVENKENWKWFLDNLIDDLDLELGSTITLMSDQHKVLTNL